MVRQARGRRRTRQARTAVWYERSRVGTLSRATDGAISFSYMSDWLTRETAFPVASALPLTQANWHGDPVIAAFDNLLPDAEGDLRTRIAERIGAPGKDVFSLLSILGRDCVGALQFLPEGEEPGARDMDYRLIKPAEMASDLASLAAAPLALGDDEDFRISIAGAQEKTAYLRIEDNWAKPRGVTPTSHIFKTPMGILPGPEEIDMSDSVENELYCMTLAGEIGLPVASVRKIVLPETKALVVERFDRRWSYENGEAILRRLPQEDVCQSLGVASSQKYQKAGGPGVRAIMALLRESDQANEDREIFFRAQIFFFLIGASDGHAKNFSLRLGRRGSFRLAPLYDILSVAPVVATGRLQRKRYSLAMSIDGHYGIDEIVPRHFEAEGRASGLPKGRSLELLDDMAARLEGALARTQARLDGQIPDDVAETISSDARARAEQVRDIIRAES